MPYSLVLERASGTHNYSVQRKVEPTHLRVLCSVPVSQAHSNKFRFAALEALCFISLWCLGAQRKGMVIIMYDNLYCKIYLSSSLDIEDLYKCINCIVQGQMEPIRTVKTGWGEIDLRKNSDFDPQRLENTPDDFIFWKYYMDVVPKEGIEQIKYINQISRLIEELSIRNIKAVASCDFEDIL